MSKLYNNALSFNSGMAPQGQFPVDDRTVVSAQSDLYITKGSESDCDFYSKAYKGMVVSVCEDGKTPTIVILKDATPYTPGKVVTVNADNFATYWSGVSASSSEEVAGTIYWDDLDA